VGGHAEVAQTLISAGANVRYKTQNNETALLLAERGKHPEIIQMLRKAGAR
jgi:ankyrin repeat protein